MTIAQALDVSQRSISAREAELFLQHILKKERSWLHAHNDQKLTPAQVKEFNQYIDRREKNEPVAYILGQKEFYGRLFHCDKRALIPRPETEGLIDLALPWLFQHFWQQVKATNKPCPLSILELGTGSGNIAITLALELAKNSIPANIYATDISPDALNLASENWQRLKDQATTRITFLVADLFDAPLLTQQAPFDLIVANLPYVSSHWQQDPSAQAEVVFHEPEVALFAGEEGLNLYQRFFAGVSPFCAAHTKILLEFGEEQTPAISHLSREFLPDFPFTVHRDYAGLDRILEIN